ncbi:hypothetical protein [Glycomyces arizonensis]|uniref:hypothetical protein n=1 Tax=Glycomyces arizonensis TaxID=256035 RepID=UPI000405CE3B|nr:hypothetical protein [Glycomyces arizonensis]
MTLLAVVLPLIWLAWLALIDWVPMPPLNDLTPDNRRSRLLAAVINYPFPLLVSGGVALGETWSLIAAAALCCLTLAGHLLSWWLPYFGLGSASQREVYERDYARTLKILPAEGHDVVPDVQHLVVGALTLAMLATTLTVTLSP